MRKILGENYLRLLGFAAEMRRLGHDITYHIIPGREHCDLPDDMRSLFSSYIKNAILDYDKGSCRL